MTIHIVAMSLVLALAGWVSAAPLTLVENGKSAYSIYHDPAAVGSVKEAAAEIQTYIAKATGAKLPIVTKLPATPVIALGDNPQLAPNGLSLDRVKLEGYRIVTKGQNLFIFGPDTPDKQFTPQGGFSRGTQNGAYTFLETVFNIRWLLPGEVGDDVPHADTVTMPETSLTDAPDFIDRRIEYIRNNDPAVIQWMKRNKLGYSIRYLHGHNWEDFNTFVYNRRPEMFTLRDGQRIRPVGANAWLCTSNPETIRFMGLKQVGYFAQNPLQFMGSLSPTDGHGAWCQCPTCTALDEKLPDGTVLHTRRIVDFYNKVSEFVAQREPNKALSGYIYLDYVDPPLDRSIRFAPNFYPAFAPSYYYGPMAYRTAERARFHANLDGWSEIVQDRMVFYGLPRLLQSSARFAIPVAPGRKVLADIFPALKKARIAGARLDGDDGWGWGGAYNWVVAKLEWKADANVDQLCDEYYDRAYGKGGRAMSQLYGIIEDGTEKYVCDDLTATYHMQPKAIKAIYLPNYGKMEELYKQASAAADSDLIKKRLELFGWSMRGLYRVLEDYGWLMNAKDSVFYMSEPDFMAWLATEKNSIYIAPGALAASGPIAAAQTRILKTPITAKAFHDPLPSAEPVKPFMIRFKNHLVLLAEKEAQVSVRFKLKVTAKGAELAYKVYDQAGSVVTSGQAAEDKEVVFLGHEGGIYHMFLDSQMIYVEVSGASWAIDTDYYDFMRFGHNYVTFAQEMTPLYFYAPAAQKQVQLSLTTAAPGETCAGTLVDPQNKVAAEFSTATAGTASLNVANVADGGFWKLVIGRAKTGTIDKVYLQMEAPLPHYLCPDPANRLVIESVQKQD